MRIQSRREFMQGALRSVAALGSAGALARFGEMNALAQGPGYRALVCIFMAGGNDGHNLLVPLSTAQQNYSAYAGARQSLAIPQTRLLPVSQGSDVYGLHPRLAELQPLYNSGKAALVANVGMLVKPISKQQYLSSNSAIIPSQLFSHSDQITQWQSAIPTGLGSTGWGGRVADAVVSQNAPSAFPAVTATSGCQLFCTGQNTFPGVVPAGNVPMLAGVAGAPYRASGQQQLLSFDNGLQLVQAANGVFGRGVSIATQLTSALATAKVNTPFPPGNPLAAQLLTVARIISVRARLGLTRQIFFCQLGGFDTHTVQMTQHDNLMQYLSQAMDAFHTATQELLVDQQVTTFTASEFGRTLQPNGQGGSDHAWGSHHIVVGGAVSGGRIYGQFPNLALGGPSDVNSRGTLLPTTSVDQYAATMAAWFGVDSTAMASVFPYLGNFTVKNLGFLA